MVAGGRELFDEIHRYGIPWFGRDRELFQVSIWFVLGGFGSGAGCARLYIPFDHSSGSLPIERAAD